MKVGRSLRGSIPIRRGLEALQPTATRLDAPILELFFSDLAREDDRLAIGREDRITILARIVFRQLPQECSVFAIKKKVRMAFALRLQITNRDDDFGGGVISVVAAR